MEQLTYTEKWYQAAHCILDAIIANDIDVQKTLKEIANEITRSRGSATVMLDEAQLHVIPLPCLLEHFNKQVGFKPGEFTLLAPPVYQRSYKSDFTSLLYRRLKERTGCLKDNNITINLETLTTLEKPND